MRAVRAGGPPDRPGAGPGRGGRGRGRAPDDRRQPTPGESACGARDPVRSAEQLRRRADSAPSDRQHRPALQRRPAGPRPDAAGHRHPARRPTCRSSSSRRPPTARCIRLVDDYEIDLLRARRRGRARPAGSASPARSRTRSTTAPPTCVVIARAADRWLAAYAQVDATLMHPLDPMTTGQTVAGMLRDRAAGVPVAAAEPSRPVPAEARHGRAHLAQPARRAAARRGAGHRRHRLGDGRDHGRRATAGADRRRSRWRCAPRARRPASSPAWSRRCSANAVPVDAARGRARRRGRRGRHRRRPGPHGQHLHHGGDRGGRRRAYGWSSTATGPPPRCAAPPTCWSTSASRSTSARTRWPAASPRPASASASPPGSTRACGTPAVPRREMGVPTVVQLPRPADQPGPARAPARSAASTPRMAPVMAEVFAAPRRLGAGDARRGRARRVHHRRADPGLGGRAAAR